MVRKGVYAPQRHASFDTAFVGRLAVFLQHGTNRNKKGTSRDKTERNPITARNETHAGHESPPTTGLKIPPPPSNVLRSKTQKPPKSTHSSGTSERVLSPTAIRLTSESIRPCLDPTGAPSQQYNSNQSGHVALRADKNAPGHLHAISSTVW